MLWYELKKVWQRPIVLLVLLGVLLYHIGYIYNDYQNYYSAERVALTEQYKGYLTDEWKQNMQKTYADYMSDDQKLKSNEELLGLGLTQNKINQMDKYDDLRLKDDILYTDEYIVLRNAYQASLFTERLDKTVITIKQGLAQRYPNMDLQMVDKAYANLRENHDQLAYTSRDGYFLLHDGMMHMIRSFTMLLVVLLATIFTREQEHTTLEVMMTCKQIHKVKQKKCITAIISASLAWGIVIVAQVITIGILIGFQGGNGFVPDFMFNNCPYLIDVSTYTAIMLFISFGVTIILALVISAVSSVIKKSNTALIISFTIFLILTFFNQAIELFYYHPSNMIGPDYILENFQVHNIFGNIIDRIYIIPCVLGAILCISFMILHKRDDRSFVLHSLHYD